ncbi:hypothetical protein COT82_01585 [Candidatus Campbellbacteria bacterium CG10_big_fil_rev_8_21_14_0_10_35_52]|uniref:Ada DNA repair metal-binding domain-containing protein n=1 Tax=Candidatus Campbellbacteria bacterium CG10_big_fil_rev_8_21_14_0_10_35_52 TaxID=1974527 RepID=A0A2M6WVC2_9BACT|nr:MAG: hypothetical protein COT82_01585 [Candidatus Campbellbacteria bacterium CG10_big_fil_rev_8_21_14_0_10_35_52]
MNISNFFQKSKRKLNILYRSDIFTATTIILIGFAGFGLGRISIIEKNKEAVKIEFPEYLSATVLNSQNSDKSNTSLSSVASAPPTGEGLLVASKNGSKYHFPWCSGGKSISEKNKIWFDSAEDARKAGYTPAANCKGLK